MQAVYHEVTSILGAYQDSGLLGSASVVGLFQSKDIFDPDRLPSQTHFKEFAEWWIQNHVVLCCICAVVCAWTLLVFLYTCIVGQDFKYELIRVSHGSGVEHVCRYCSYILVLPLHFFRSMENASGSLQVASSTERRYLEESRHIFSPTIADFLAVRRSMMYVAAAFLLLSLYVAVNGIVIAHTTSNEWTKQSQAVWTDLEGHTPKSFAQFLAELHDYVQNDRDKENLPNQPQAWSLYTRFMFNSFYMMLLKQTSSIDVFTSSMKVVCIAISLLWLVWSMKKWALFHISRKTLLFGWVFVFIAPVLVTLVPTRMLMSWDEAKPIVSTYAAELAEHLAGDRGDKVWEACGKLMDTTTSSSTSRTTTARSASVSLTSSTTSATSASVSSTSSTTSATSASVSSTTENEVDLVTMQTDSGKLATYVCSTLVSLPSRHMKCCAIFDIIDYDFRPIHDQCQSALKYLQSKRQEEQQKGVQTCTDLCTKVIVPDLHKILMGLSDALVLISAMSPVVPGLLTFFLGIRGFQSALPVVLALAPAMLRGALKVKALAPQSSVSGMFILLLPWLYCPMSWCLYSTAYQVICDGWLLIGLLVLAFWPLGCYLYVSNAFKITQPHTDHEVRKLLCVMHASSVIVALIVVALLIFWVFRLWSYILKRRLSVDEDFVMEMFMTVPVMQSDFWLQIIAETLACYFLTALVTVDFIVFELGNHRRYETLLDIAGQLDDAQQRSEDENFPDGLRSVHERLRLKEVAKQRKERLESLEHIVFNEAPMRAARQQSTAGSSFARATSAAAARNGPPAQEVELSAFGLANRRATQDADPYDAELWDNLVKPPLYVNEAPASRSWVPAGGYQPASVSFPDPAGGQLQPQGWGALPQPAPCSGPSDFGLSAQPCKAAPLVGPSYGHAAAAAAPQGPPAIAPQPCSGCGPLLRPPVPAPMSPATPPAQFIPTGASPQSLATPPSANPPMSGSRPPASSSGPPTDPTNPLFDRPPPSLRDLVLPSQPISKAPNPLFQRPP